MNTCDWIGLEPSEFSNGENQESIVVLNEALKKKYKTTKLTDNGWLVVWEHDIEVDFAVLEENGSCDGRIEAVVIFHGNGIGGSLRELRHSYWGDDGYIFCLDTVMRLISKSLVALEEYFDAID